MARARKNNDNLAVAAISAAISLLIVVVFYGGTITGNTPADVALTTTVAETVSCSITANPAIAIGAVSLETTDQAFTPSTFTMENAGSVYVNVTAAINQSVADLLGTTTGTSNIELAVEAESGTELNNTSGIGEAYGSATSILTLLSPAAAADAAVFTPLLNAGGASNLVGDSNEATLRLVCTSDTDAT
jgi:hypothetical protein